MAIQQKSGCTNKMKNSFLLTAVIFVAMSLTCYGQLNTSSNKVLSQETMEKVYEEVKTDFKYGIVFQHPDSTKMIDSPTIFRKNSVWYMTYIVFDGKGYETWLAESIDLLDWESKGKVLSFTDNTWDANQKAGYLSLVNIDWGGDYSVEKYQNNYWMTYLG